MRERLLICTDLDRTLIPNGVDAESPEARIWFHKLAALPGIVLAYVTGRDQGLVREAVEEYELPLPAFVLGDVGSTIYACEGWNWQHWEAWEAHIAPDWGGRSHAELATLLQGLPPLQLQEEEKQNTHKLSYYVSLGVNHRELMDAMEMRLRQEGIRASLIWSIDEPADIGLLDVLPARATKRHAIEFLMEQQGFGLANTVFAGDSGNDLPVLVSPIPAILVHNASPEIKLEALQLAKMAGTAAALYLARGGFHNMNGNYAAGILEGLAHYHSAITTRLESE
ncbi:MAG: HAD-IIB family hydrolase [Proteobacteria bacterium]|nr:HAD-IIB family hydrolase [Pseudomonadota bacterium]MBU1648407.1 HAD-IIB family hydrolase [Pseudomonadota bacterium]MBU1986497.1 HAD-IIB family hydrolase [Pseudomonadota bacterium]